MSALHTEVFLACAYALFLFATAAILEWTARGTHKRAKTYRLRGFTFHEHLDAWQCPNGEYLHRTETDHTLRAVRYRAQAAGCNACAMKTFCTDSDRGREIVRSTEDWLDTEIGRFHRILSFALLSLSALIITVVWVRHHNPSESAVLSTVLAGIVLVGAALTRAFRKKAAPEKPPVWIPLTPWSEGNTPDASKQRPTPFT